MHFEPARRDPQGNGFLQRFHGDGLWRAHHIESGRSANKGSLMMNYNGWMGGGMWIWTVIGVLLVVLLVVVINKVSNK